LSWAAWWLGDTEATVAARERAFRAYRQAGDSRNAAHIAVWLANDAIDFQGAIDASGTTAVELVCTEQNAADVDIRVSERSLIASRLGTLTQ
jgi:hypothetical protein